MKTTVVVGGGWLRLAVVVVLVGSQWLLVVVGNCWLSWKVLRGERVAGGWRRWVVGCVAVVGWLRFVDVVGYGRLVACVVVGCGCGWLVVGS